MHITKDDQTYDFEKWPKWRQLDTSIELLVLEGERVLEHQREGNSLYLFIEGGMVYGIDPDEPTAVALLVLEYVGITAETFGDENGPPAAHFELGYLTGSIPILRQTGRGEYEKVFDQFWFDVDASYSGGADLRSTVHWGFTAGQVTAYWKELLL